MRDQLYRKKRRTKKLKTSPLSESDEKTLSEFKQYIDREFTELNREAPIFKAITGGYPFPIDRMYLSLLDKKASSLEQAKIQFLKSLLSKQYQIPIKYISHDRRILSSKELAIYQSFITSLKEIETVDGIEKRSGKPTNKTWKLYYGYSELLYSFGIDLEVHNRIEAEYPFSITYRYK